MTAFAVIARTLLVLTLSATAGWAAEARLHNARSLMDLLFQALQTSPTLGNASAAETAAARASTDAFLGFAPRASWTFDNSGERLNVKRSTSSIYQLGISDFSNYGNTLQITQPLFDPRLFAQLHGAWAGLRRSRAELAAARQNAIFQVIQSYLMALGASDALAVALAEQQALARQHSQVVVRMQRGLASQADVDEVASRLLQSRAQGHTARATLVEAFAAVTHHVGGPVAALLPLSTMVAMPPPQPADVEVWVAEARQQNSDVKALEGAAGEAWSVFEQHAAALLPRVDLNFSQTRAQTGGSVYGGGSLTTDRTVLFRLTVPLFNADGAGYPLRAAEARARAAEFKTQDQQLDVEERVRTAYAEVIANALRATELARAAEAQERVTQSKHTKFAAGVIRITEVLEAEHDLYQARRMLLAARYNYLLNLMQLKRLAGDISEADALFIDALLQRDGRPVESVTAADEPAEAKP